MSNIHISCAFAFDKLTELLQQKLAGFEMGSLKLQHLELSGDDHWMYVALQLTGAYNGRVVLQFGLDFDSEQGRFVLSGLKARIDEDGLLAKGATWVINNVFGDKIDSRLEGTLNDRFHQVLIDLSTQYGDFQLQNGIEIRTDLYDFEFEDIRWDTTYLYFTTTAHGTMRLNL